MLLALGKIFSFFQAPYISDRKPNKISHFPIFFCKKKQTPTFQMNHSFVGSFHHNRFISSLIALQPCRTAGLVAHKTLVTLQHKDWSIDEIKIIFGVLIHSIAIGKKMAGFFRTDKFVIVGWKKKLYIYKFFK